MNQTPAEQLLPDELSALMHFYAEAGVSWLSEDEPVDRFAEFVAMNSAKSQARLQPPAVLSQQPATGERQARRPERAEARPAPLPQVAIPDAEAVASAVAIAAQALSIEALIDAVAEFRGCNLRNSARQTVFAGGRLDAEIAVISGVSSADDDRGDGAPFAGTSGQMLARMLGGIGLDSGGVLTCNLIPWRTPGDKPPTVREVEICLPFGLRLLELVRPRSILVLGNFAVRVLSGDPKGGIHSMRGKWFDVEVAGRNTPAMATFHPQDLLTAPISKRQAWQDLLKFSAERTG